MPSTERRNGNRKSADMPIFKLVGERSVCCRVDDISPTGVRLLRCGEPASEDRLCNLELHLVPNRLTTVLTGRRVWQDDSREAFEFVAPTFAQQAILERLLDNY